MSTTLTPIGNNSALITRLPSSNISATIAPIIRDYLITKGWELHGTGSNLIVMKALNNDGQTYKYIGLGFSVSTTLTLSTYEFWNTSTQVATNPTTTVSISLISSCWVYVFATQRYCGILSTFATTQTDTSTKDAILIGCFEVSRDNPQDTVAAGFPPYVQINTNIFLNSGNVYPVRTFANTTGTSAFGSSQILTPFVRTISGSLSSTLSNFQDELLTKTVFDYYVGDFSTSHNNLGNIRGKIYGLRGIIPSGNPGSIISINASPTGFISSSAPLTPHIVLPCISTTSSAPLSMWNFKSPIAIPL